MDRCFRRLRTPYDFQAMPLRGDGHIGPTCLGLKILPQKKIVERSRSVAGDHGRPDFCAIGDFGHKLLHHNLSVAGPRRPV